MTSRSTRVFSILILIASFLTNGAVFAMGNASSSDCAPISGTSVLVNSAKDDGTDLSTECTLREAVEYLNNNGDGSIYFDISNADTIYLESVLEIGVNMVIDGSNPDKNSPLTIDGSNIISSDGNFFIYSPAGEDSFINFDISNLILQNSPDAAIQSDGYGGNLTVSWVTFDNNGVGFAQPGGAISWEAESDSYTLSIENSVFTNNEGDGWESYPNYEGGGAVYAAYGNVHISDSTFVSNSTNGFCGAIDFRSETPVTFSIEDSTFNNNRAGVGSEDGGGGAVCVNSEGNSVIKNSTFDGNNSTYQGGALFNGSRFGTIYVINSTFSGNSSYAQGSVFSGVGGWDVFAMPIVKEFSTFKIYNSTIANNFGTAPVEDYYRSPVFDNHAAHYYIYNSVIANNTATYGGALCWTSDDNDTNGEGYVKGDHNLVYGNNSTNDLSACPSDSSDDMLYTGNYITGDPKLVALADNGGPTKTMALGSGSAAIDAVDLSGCVYDDGTSKGVTLATDQRGYGRPVNTTCDLGAFEYGAVSNDFGITEDDVELVYDATNPDTFSFTFNLDVYDPEGDSDLDDVTNPINWLFVELGANAVLDTETCLGGVVSDDVEVSVSSVTYVAADKTATIHLATPLTAGDYAIFACGTTSIWESTHTNELNNGEDSIFEFTVADGSAPGAPGGDSGSNSGDPQTSLPNTGFAQGQVSVLTQQPSAKAYNATTMRLSIPALGVSSSIVGVPRTMEGWDVTWLGADLGWLEGTAYPTWEGNTVLTGHVWDAYNNPGALYGLYKLATGDIIELTSNGSIYVYEVRESVLRWSTERFDNVIRHQEDDWLTLITCEGYQTDAKDYLFRRVVSAELVMVR